MHLHDCLCIQCIFLYLPILGNIWCVQLHVFSCHMVRHCTMQVEKLCIGYMGGFIGNSCQKRQPLSCELTVATSGSFTVSSICKLCTEFNSCQKHIVKLFIQKIAFQIFFCLTYNMLFNLCSSKLNKNELIN